MKSCILTHIHKSAFTHKHTHPVILAKMYSHMLTDTGQVQPQWCTQNTTALSLSTIYHYLENHSHVIWSRGRWNLSNLGSHLVPSGVLSQCQSQSCSTQCSCRWSGSQLGQCYSWSAWIWLLLLWWRSPRCSGRTFQTPTQFPSMTRPEGGQRVKRGYAFVTFLTINDAMFWGVCLYLVFYKWVHEWCDGKGAVTKKTLCVSNETPFCTVLYMK